MNRNTFTAVLLAGASALAFPSLAAAQAPAAQVEEVVVTGSRVIKNGNNSPTPVTVVQVQDLQNTTPTTLADGLNTLPVFSGSRNQYGNPNPQGGNGAANQLNLRNLGSNRNLILFDGHRVPPTLTDGTVDVDMIPQQLIQRVDMVTGGVSAVYGSDAISGVINFVIDRRYNGIKGHAQYGFSDYNDGRATNIGVAAGSDLFGGRGHIEGSYEYRDDKGILFRSSRPWNNQWAATGLGTAAFPYYLVPNVRLAQTAFGGLIAGGALNGQVFKTNGVLSPFQAGTATGSAGVQIGGDGAHYDDSLKAPLKSQQFFGRFDYDFSDNLHFYASGSVNLKRNVQYLVAPVLSNMTMSAQNAFLAPAYRSQLVAANQTTFRISEFMEKSAPRRAPETNSEQFFLNTGFEGKIGDYDWGLSYTRGQTKQTTTTNNNLNMVRLAAALDAVVNPTTGQVVCNVTLTNPGLHPTCVPLNIFGPTAASSSAVDYILGDTDSTGHTVMDDFEGSIAGSPLNSWAGPIQVAISGEYRNQSYYQTNNAPQTQLSDCTGLRFNCVAANPEWQNSGQPRSKVSQRVWETAIEADLPVLKDAAFAKSLNLNGAARYTSYKTSGDYVTWKLGVDWHLSDSLRFRGAKSRDIRAPTLSELYAPAGRGTQTSTDLLTGQTPTVPLLTGGNPNLVAEIGHTTTAGVVWRPDFAPGFSLAVDAYHIRITDALSSVLGTVAAAQNACYASGGSSPYCTLQQRPNGYTDKSPSNAVTAWRTIQINISEVVSKGVDIEANYTTELFGRPLVLRGLVNHQPTLIFDTPGLTRLNHAGVAYSTNALYPAPKWAATFTTNFKPFDNFTVATTTRWRDTLTMKNDPSQVWVNPKVDNFYTTNLNLSYDVKTDLGQYSLFMNVQNLFDKTPPPAAFFSAQTQPGQFGGWAIGDDPVGRYWTLGVRFRH
jgi:iron complex outermembrane receptor protein